jgi:hypothetical protein
VELNEEFARWKAHEYRRIRDGLKLCLTEAEFAVTFGLPQVVARFGGSSLSVKSKLWDMTT